MLACPIKILKSINDFVKDGLKNLDADEFTNNYCKLIGTIAVDFSDLPKHYPTNKLSIKDNIFNINIIFYMPGFEVKDQGYWNQAFKTMTLYIPVKIENNSYYLDLDPIDYQDLLEHECRHLLQTYFSEAIFTNKKINRKTKKILSKLAVIEKGLYESGKIKEQQAVHLQFMDVIRNCNHFGLPGEYYKYNSNIIFDLESIEDQIKYSSPKEFFPYLANQGKIFYHFFDSPTKDNFLTYLNANSFFLSLEKRNYKMWTRAVKELYKAIEA